MSALRAPRTGFAGMWNPGPHPAWPPSPRCRVGWGPSRWRCCSPTRTRPTMLAAENVWSVAQVVARIKRHVEGDAALQHLWVMGEVSNFKAHSSGHWYFTLKDTAQIPAVMFRSDAERSAF